MRIVLTAFALTLAPAATSAQEAVMTPLSPPIVIAHRGASGLRPEHTLAAYELAIDQGADFIEPDLVPTSDDELVARHENDITDTTDVAAHPEFAGRRTVKTIDGERHDGWFVEDFTLAELKTLRAKERLPQLRPANTAYDGKFDIPTLAEIIALAKRRHVGIYPETKHPTYFAGIGHPTDALLVAELNAAGWDSADAPVFIQSFEVANLKRIHAMTKIRLIQLLDGAGGPADGAAPSYAAMTTSAGLRDVATYAFGIGPNKAMLWQGDTATPTTLVAGAHAAGLRVHPWTFRAENYFVPTRFRKGDDPRAHGDVAAEIAAALRLGIDGFFTDFPETGVEARARKWSKTMRILILLAAPLLSAGCVRTVASVATAPFKVAGQTVDWATTSQDEADRNYGRKMRKKEAREGRERRDYEKMCRKHPEDCRGYDGACSYARRERDLCR